MKYFSEETVHDIISEAEDCTRAYEFGCGNRTVNLSDYPYIEIPDEHGRLIDADALPIKDEWTLVGTDVVWDAPTVLEASN